jgi:hypothetical protein
MNNHWPILLGILVIALGASLGMWQRERATAIAGSTSVAPQEAEPSASAARATPSAPAAPAVPEKVEAPAPPVAEPAAQPMVQAQAVPQTPMPPRTRQAAPPPRAAQAQPTVLADLDDRVKLLEQVKAALAQGTGAAPINMAGNAWAVAPEGARAEVHPLPNWSINIYNNNPQQPDAETEMFKKCVEVVTATIGMDMKQKAREAAGRKYLQTTSKLGTVYMVRDPAANNAIIRPLGQTQVTQPVPQPALQAPAAQPEPQPKPAPTPAGNENF